MSAREFSIGEAAKATGLTVKTIRYYEQIGLIPKARRHDGAARTGGNRVYGEADVGRLRFIHHARLIDLSLDDIRQLLTIADGRGCPGEQPRYEKILARRLEEVNERITHLLGLRSRIEELMPKGASPRREGEGEGEDCTWETCGCMRPADKAVGESSDRKGEGHV